MDVAEISKRKTRPSQRLLDPGNAAQHEVVSHQLAADAHTAAATGAPAITGATQSGGSTSKRRASDVLADEASNRAPGKFAHFVVSCSELI